MVQRQGLPITTLFDELESVLQQLMRVERPGLRVRALSLLTAIEKAFMADISQRFMPRPSGETVRTLSELISSASTLFGEVRLAVLQSRYDVALELLQRIETPDGPLPGLRHRVSEVVMLLSMTTVPKEAPPEEVSARMMPESMVRVPTELLTPDLPPVVVPLYNLLMRKGRIERNAAFREIHPERDVPPEVESAFDRAWTALVERGYAEVQVDRRGREYLVLR